jgi:hypothetical protein
VKVDTIQNSFASGEIAPSLFGRTDISQYANAAQTLENFLIRPYGSVISTPGTQFVSECKTGGSTGIVRLIEFIFSRTDSYVIEMGVGYFRFYTNGAIVVSPGTTPYEVAHTYTASDINDIQFCQLNDVIYMTHPDYSPKKLTRLASTSWTFADFPFIGGPFLPDNTTSITLKSSGTSGTVNITVSPTSSGVFVVSGATTLGHKNTYWKIGSTITDATTGLAVQGYVQLTNVVNTYTATASVLKTLVSTVATTSWAEGSWSDVRGWPARVTFHQQRLFMARTDYEPQNLWGSKSFVYDDFALDGANDDDAINITLASNESNDIKWLAPGKELLTGTYGGEFAVKTGDGSPLTPSNTNVRKESSWGSEAIIPRKIGNFLYYVQRFASRIREIFYNWDYDAYRSLDKTILSPHISGDGFKEISYQQNPDTILWCVCSNGTMATMTREVDQEVQGWSRQTTDGLYESIATIPSQDGPFDEVWVVVNRTINGTTRRYIERFKSQEVPDKQEECWYVHSGLSLDAFVLTEASLSTTATTISVSDVTAVPTVQSLVGGNIGWQITNGKYYNPFSSTEIAPRDSAAVEGTTYLASDIIPCNGTISSFMTKLQDFTGIAAGKDVTATVVINGTSSTLVTQYTDTGDDAVQIDSTHTASVNAGDCVSLLFNVTGAGTAASSMSWSMNFTPEKAYESVHFGGQSEAYAAVQGDGDSQYVSDEDTYYCCPCGATQWNTSDEKFIVIPCSGTIKNFYVSTTIPDETGGNFNFKLRKNGVDTTCVVNITESANSGGDTTHEFTVSQGDLISIKAEGISAVNAWVYVLSTSFVFESDTVGLYPIFAFADKRLDAQGAQGTPSDRFISGRTYKSYKQTTSDWDNAYGQADQLTNQTYILGLTAYCPFPGDRTYYLYKNGIQQAMYLDFDGTSTSASTTGLCYCSSGDTIYTVESIGATSPDTYESISYVASSTGRWITPAKTSATILVTSSSAYFSAGDVGQRVRALNSDGEIDGEIIITGFTSSTVVIGTMRYLFGESSYDAGDWGLSVTQVSGLQHLEGKTLSILGDGGTEKPNPVVSNGTITLSTDYFVIIAGLPYTQKITTLAQESGSQRGTAQGKVQRINQVGFKVNRSHKGFLCGGTEDYVEKIQFREPSTLMGTPESLYTGTIPNISFRDDYQYGSHVHIQNPDPLPIEMLSIITTIDTNDK